MKICRCFDLFPDTVTVADVFGGDSYTYSYSNGSNYTTFDYPSSCDSLISTYGEAACDKTDDGFGELCKRKSRLDSLIYGLNSYRLIIKLISDLRDLYP